MKNETYVNPILPDNAAPRGWTEIEGDGAIEGDHYKLVVLNLPPYPCLIDEKTNKLEIRVPIGKLPAPMFSEALVKHVVETLGKRDAKAVLDKLVDEYYRQLVTKQM